ncbi:cobalt ABC transporter ATP-binding protein [Bacillus sp. TS-2]|nr:cobalt ABC transporter ATP-binding protein [Bacillus sp. TS-2]
MSFISFEEVTYRYEENDTSAISNLSLSFTDGEWVAIVGQNGSGKSTLGRMINALNLPTAGKVYIEEDLTSNTQAHKRIRHKIGMIFQNPEHQFVATTVRDDIAFGLENQGMKREDMLIRIERYANLLDITHLLDKEPHRLSGGQKQRVAIAGVVALEPKVIIFDEATSMLDPVGRQEMIELMDMLSKKGITIISITHDMEEAARAKRMIVLQAGELAADGTPRELFQNDALLQEVGLEKPFTMRLQERLKGYGHSMHQPALSERELIDQLWIYHSKK